MQLMLVTFPSECHSISFILYLSGFSVTLGSNCFRNTDNQNSIFLRVVPNLFILTMAHNLDSIAPFLWFHFSFCMNNCLLSHLICSCFILGDLLAPNAVGSNLGRPPGVQWLGGDNHVAWVSHPYHGAMCWLSLPSYHGKRNCMLSHLPLASILLQIMVLHKWMRSCSWGSDNSLWLATPLLSICHTPETF